MSRYICIRVTLSPGTPARSRDWRHNSSSSTESWYRRQASASVRSPSSMAAITWALRRATHLRVWGGGISASVRGGASAFALLTTCPDVGDGRETFIPESPGSAALTQNTVLFMSSSPSCTREQPEVRFRNFRTARHSWKIHSGCQAMLPSRNPCMCPKT